MTVRPMQHLARGPVQLVAIAGSAGFMKPLKTIVAGLPKRTDTAYVILIHRARGGPHLLDSILAAGAHLPVSYVRSVERLTAGHVYIAPPGEHHLAVRRGYLELVGGPKVGFHRPAADVLFNSIADSFGERAIAVVLSGAGKNGVHGLTAIRNCGGRVLVQSPAEAEHPSMPQHALLVAPDALCAPAVALAAWLAEHAMSKPAA